MRYLGLIAFLLLPMTPILASSSTALATQLARHLFLQSPDQRVWQSIVEQKKLDIAHAYIPQNPELRLDITHSDSNTQPSWGSDFEWTQPLMWGNRHAILTQDATAQLAVTLHHIRIAQINRYADILQTIVDYDISRQSWGLLHQRMPQFNDLIRFAQSRPQRSIQEQVDVAILTGFLHELSLALHQRHTAMTDAKLAIHQWGDFTWQGAIQRPALPHQLPTINWSDDPQWSYWQPYRNQLETSLKKWQSLNDPSISLMIKSSVPFSKNNGGSTVGIGFIVMPNWHHQTKGQLATTQVALDSVVDQEARARQSILRDQQTTWHDYESAMWVLKEAGYPSLRATTRSLNIALQGFRRGLVSAVSVVELGRLLMQQEDRYIQALHNAHRAHITWGRYQGHGVE